MYNENVKDVVTTTLGGCIEISRPTLTEHLKGDREQLRKRLAELDAAIGALESNPDVQKVLDLVQKVARY